MKPSDVHRARWHRAAMAMRENEIDAMFVMRPANLLYLTGDGRPCALALLTNDPDLVLSVPACDVTSVVGAAEFSELHEFDSEEEMFHGFRTVLERRGLLDGRIGIERNFFDASLYEVFVAHILRGREPVSSSAVLARLRMIKDADEIALISAAAEVADVGMSAAVAAVRPGSREIDVAGEAELAMRRAGAEGWATPLYVASGPRSAMAHGPATRRLIGDGDVVQIHVAPVVDGYTADLCRTVFAGDGPDAARRDLDAYVRAQVAGVEAASPGRALLGIDAAMSNTLAEFELHDRFLRPVFHGVGIEHEEAPIPGGHAVIHGEERVDTVQPGMVLAIGNCGLYRETYGVRVEDTVCVTDAGPVRLTQSALTP